MTMDGPRKPIVTFRDLEVYQNTYGAMLVVMQEVLPQLPPRERFDLTDQLSRSSKVVPRLIAEGFAKKHQRAGFQKYLDDAMAECNETIVSLEQAKDIYNVNSECIEGLLKIYDQSACQLFKLAEAWDKFTNQRRRPFDQTGRQNQ